MRTEWSTGLAKAFGVEREELSVAALMSGALFLLIALQTTIKVVRDATFLSRFDIADLSYVMLAMAFVTGAALKLYNRATAGRPRNRVIWVLNLTVAGTLLLFALALRFGGRHVPVIFYLWTAVATLALLSEFWLLANDLFHARQARRLFTVIAAGGVLGGVFGGASSQILSRRIPVASFLVLAAIELVVAALLCELAWRHLAERTTVERADAHPVRNLFQILRENEYARWIAVVAVLMTVVTTVGDWQFKAYAKLHFASHEADMARFFSIVATVLGGLSFLLQLVGTRRLLRVVGARGCMRALPVSCVIGAGFVLMTLGLPIAPLLAATAGSILIDGVQFSVDRSATELLFTPLAEDTRPVFKRFVDTALDRFSGGLAALVWIGLVYFARIDRPDRLVYASVAVLALSACWLFAVHKLSFTYVDAYRAFIGAPIDAEPPPAAPPHRRRRAERLLSDLHRDAPHRHSALRKLTVLQSSSASLELAPELVTPHLDLELDDLEVLERLDASFSKWGAPRPRPLPRLVKERIAHGLERVIRLLAMLYPPSDITSLHRALRRHSDRQRAAALEFLEALIDIPHKHRLLAVLERIALPRGELDPVSREEGLQRLLTINDSRLRAWAVWHAVGSGLLLDAALRLAASDPSWRVRAMAKLAVSRRRRGPRDGAPATPIGPTQVGEEKLCDSV